MGRVQLSTPCAHVTIKTKFHSSHKVKKNFNYVQHGVFYYVISHEWHCLPVSLFHSLLLVLAVGRDVVICAVQAEAAAAARVQVVVDL